MVAGAPAVTAAARLAHRLADGLPGADYNRFPTSTAASATFKQWVHLAVVDPAIALVANFSALPAPPGPRESPVPPEPREHRLTLLVHAGALAGHVRRFPAERCAMPAGRTQLRFDRNELTTTGDVHQLLLDEPALALRARLTMRAVTSPAVLHNLPLGPLGRLGSLRTLGTRSRFHWAVVPRLVATGIIEHAGCVHELVEAPAYRDRNWGSFCFGDVAWDWGYVTATAGGPPCALAFARLMDASRTHVVEQQILVWWGQHLLASFRDHEVSVACEGAFDGWMATIPPALALCRPGRATGVPEVVTVTGQSSRGRVELRFTRAATARIVVPNESRLGTTAIYESFGGASVAGRVDDQDVALDGRGFFECVHA
jgi:hypothetical protein